MKKLLIGLAVLAVVLAVVLGVQVGEKNKLQTEVNTQKASIAELGKVGDELTEVKAQLEKEVESSAAVATQLEEARTQHEELAAKLKEADEARIAASAELDSLKESLTEAQAQVSALTEEKGSLAGELAVAQAAVKEAADQLEALNAQMAGQGTEEAVEALITEVPEAEAPKAEPVSISLFHTNDVHSRVEGNDKDLIGYAKLATIVKEARQAGPTLLLDVGDVLHGMSFATVVEGESIVELMNLLGYDAMAPGNHDFNYGYPRLKELEAQMNFPLINSNLLLEDGSQAFQPYTMAEVGDKRIALVGAANPQIHSAIHPDRIKGLQFEGLDKVEKAVQDALAEKPDAVIILAHWGADGAYEPNSSVLAKIPGVNLVIDGHSHTKYEDIKQVEGAATIVSANQYLQTIGHLTLTFDADNKLSIEVDPITFDRVADVQPDEEIVKAIDQIKASMEEMLGKVVGKTQVLLDGERANVRTMETNLGDLAADALRLSTGADFAFTNGGGIRTSVPEGDITKGKLIEVFPFGNSVVLIEVTGEQLLAAMEHGLRLFPEQNGGFPQISGGNLSFDPVLEAGKRVVSLTIAGAPVEPEKTYTLATNDFTAAGGDDYLMLKDAKVLAYGGTLDEALIAHIQDLGVVEQQVDGRLSAVMPEAAPEAPAEEAVVEEAPAEEAPAAEAEASEPEAEKKLELTLEELAKFNGKDGQRAYVAVDGIIYDVTDAAPWQNGDHNGFEAGNDLTDAIKNVSPHGVAKLKNVVEVGTLVTK